MSLWSRFTNVFHTRQLERELDEELRFHLEQRARALMAAGWTADEAAREARRRFGNPLTLRERSRDVKLLPWLESIGRDVRLGARMLRKNAVVTAAAVTSLSLALGACVAAFALVDALILRPLPVRDPHRLIYVTFQTDEPDRPESDTFNDPLFVRLRDASAASVDLFAMSTQVIRRASFGSAADGKEPIRTQFVSGEAFDRLGIGPSAGRVLTRHDDDRGGAPTAVLSHAFWMRRFGGDPAVLGRAFAIDDRQFQIVGVADRRFAGIEPGRPTDVWMPYGSYDPRAFGNPSYNWFRIIGRLRDGAEVGQAQAVVQTAFTAFRTDVADRMVGNQSPEKVARFLQAPVHVRSAANGPSPLRRQFERALWILGAIAALVLFIAGSNVANLFLVRTAAREREMALRLSIGAGRGRLIQQLFVESALVAAATCVLGVLFASAAAPAVVNMLASPDDPVQLDLAVGWRIFAVAGGLTVLITVLFGLVPALRASSVAPIGALKTGGRSSGGARAMRPFVAVQAAFGVLVLFIGSLLVLSFVRLSSVKPGFATSEVILFSLEAADRKEFVRQRVALLQVLERIRALTGVEAASAAEANVLGRAWTYYVQRPDKPTENVEATMAPVTDGFFETMRIPLLAGRTLSRDDTLRANSSAVIVNRAFAVRYFGDERVVGRTFAARFADITDAPVHEVVGVVADTKYDLRKPAAPTIYIPLRLRTSGTIYARVSGDPSALALRIRGEIGSTTDAFRVTTVTSQSTLVDRTLLRERLLATLSGFFAIVGLVLVAVGLYAVLSYAVMQRTREIGIRVALGAPPRRVLRSVVGDGGSAAAAGAAFGLAAALYASRFVESLLFEVTPKDFWSIATPLGAFLAAAALASTLPALRATRVDPVDELRYE